jgi:uncharacterized protein (TIGR00730 family)
MSETQELGRVLAQKGYTLVFGGGAQGLMGAAARGFKEMNGRIIGIAPTFFMNVDGVLYDQCSQFIYTETMRERKQLMEEHSDAFLVTPGGIGTFEEFFEILTLKQLGRHTKPILIYNIFALSFSGILSESISLISVVIGIIRYRNTQPRPISTAKKIAA